MVASPRKAKNPNTSVSVVMNTAEASAGSIFKARSPIGIRVAAIAAHQQVDRHRQRQDQSQEDVPGQQPRHSGPDRAEHQTVAQPDERPP